MENHLFHGKIHYKSPFSIAMLNYQRVNLRSISWETEWRRKKHRPCKVPRALVLPCARDADENMNGGNNKHISIIATIYIPKKAHTHIYIILYNYEDKLLKW